MSDQLQVAEHNSQRILTTQQIAEAYDTTVRIISNNFNRNKEHYTEGKHYYALEGKEKTNFLKNHHQFEDGLKKAKVVYLWTEKGAFLHAKSIGTNKAWEVYETLIDEYYRLTKETPQFPQEDINKAFRLRRDANMWLVERMRFTTQERTSVIALQGHLNGLGFAENAFLDTSLGQGFKPWCEEQGYDMSLVRYTEQKRLVGWKLNEDRLTYNFNKPTYMEVLSYPEDPFGVAWARYLVECYWPEKFLPYIQRKYKGEERARNIEVGLKVINFYTGIQISQKKAM